MNFRLIFLGVALSLSSIIQAQMLGVTIEIDTAFYGPNTPSPADTFDPAGSMDGMVTYQVYADFTNTTDVLSAIYADVVALGTPSMYINAPCGCHNPVNSSIAMDGSNSSLFWTGPFADWQYDTYWTIGMPSGNSPGINPQVVGVPDGLGICSSQITNGSVFTTGSPVNAIAGADLRILIAQVTTCGDWCFSANFQIFIDGDQLNPQFFLMPSEICAQNPCDNYLLQEAVVTGETLPCAGNSSTVGVEFLGDGDVALSTFQLFDQGGNIIAGPQNTPSFDNLGAGAYTMILTDQYSCMDTTIINVVAPPQIVADFNMSVDNACFGQGDATVCILTPPTGGTGQLSISVNDPIGAPVSSVAGLNECWTSLVCQSGDGAFVFSVQDSQGCVKDTIISVNCPLPIDAVISSTDIDCQGNANGSISAVASGGSGVMSLVVNVDTLALPNSFTDLVPGLYNVQIIDDFGCSPGVESIEILEPNAITLQVLSAAPISCGSDCNGAVDLLYFGGTGILILEVANSITGDIASSLDSLCASDYIASIIDENGCSTQSPFTIDAPPPLGFLISTSPVSCTGMSNGTADVFPTGGTGELTWTVLDTIGNIANLNNLSNMTYTAIVTDVIGCEAMETFFIDVEIVTDMVLTTFTSPVTCWNAADGSITVSVIGGSEPFTYLWSDPFGQTTSTAVGLTQDTYTITVTDNNGCNVSQAEVITHIQGCLFIADAITPNGDGYNDEWIVGGLLDFPSSEVKVYNRYGQLLFFSTGGDVHWDGRFNNQRLPIADYYYTIELNPYDPPITGTVSLKY